MADYAQTAASVLASANAVRFNLTPPFVTRGEPPIAQPNVCIAGATLTAGQPVYQATDGTFKPADANGADPLYKCVGIAENGAAAGQPVSIVVKDPAFTPGCTMAVGDTVCVSGTAGKICPSSDVAAGWFNTFLGVAFSTTQMNLNPTRSDAVKI